jgi:hypothetical protein
MGGGATPLHLDCLQQHITSNRTLDEWRSVVMRHARKRWKPKTPYRLVAVEWEDSQRPLSPWQWVDEFTLPDAVRCISVGFIVAESKTAIALAANLGDVDCERTQACGIIRIPTKAVHQIVDL